MAYLIMWPETRPPPGSVTHRSDFSYRTNEVVVGSLSGCGSTAINGLSLYNGDLIHSI